MAISILIVLNLLGWLLFTLIFRMVVRKSVAPKQVLSRIEAEIDSLVTELNGTTERNIRLLEETLVRLRAGVEQADKRIRILKGENRRNQLPEAAPSREYTHLSSHKPINLEVIEDDAGTDTGNVAPEIDGEKENENQDLRTMILSLHRQGLDSRLIALRAGKPLGEVELIISLGEPADR